MKITVFSYSHFKHFWPCLKCHLIFEIWSSTGILSLASDLATNYWFERRFPETAGNLKPDGCYFEVVSWRSAAIATGDGPPIELITGPITAPAKRPEHGPGRRLIIGLDNGPLVASISIVGWAH